MRRNKELSLGPSVPCLSCETFTLVVPTLNEAGNIESVLRRVQNALEPLPLLYEVIVVDDGSTDGTPDIVRACCASDSRIRLISRQNQRGLAGAVVHGWLYSDADLLGVMDADLQHPPELLPSLLEAMCQGYDIAIASRYAGKNATRGWNPVRAVISRVSTLAALPLLQRRELRIEDPMSGFFVVRREAIDGISFETRGFKLLLEILVRARLRSAREIPFHFGVRTAGKSKAGAAVALHYLHLLGKLSRDLMLRPSPQ
jgi:dolichol-phosphate mannosyltransferase